MRTNQVFSDLDEEISGIFAEIGLKKNTARVLAILLKDIDLTSREIERWADLRQPEVSFAIKDLMGRQWIGVSRNLGSKKGRPIQVYRLAVPVEGIIDQLQRTITTCYQEKIHSLERVRELIRESRIRV